MVQSEKVKSFKDFGIENTEKAFTGDKIKIKKVLNMEIRVLGFRITDSKFEGKGKRLDMQIQVKDTKHLVFTSAVGLMEVIQRVPEFPFSTTIVENNERYEFT